MRSVLLGLVLVITLVPCLCLGQIELDVTESTFQSTGPATLLGTDVYVPALDQGLYSCTFQWDGNALTWRLVHYERTGQKGLHDALYYARQLAGQWTFTYVIISTFTDRLRLDTIHTDKPNDEGGYFVSGSDGYGNAVGGCHWPEQGFFMVLDPGSIIDQVYVFTIEGNQVKSGFYQHYSHSSGRWSNTYALSGTKVPLDPVIKTDALENETRRSYRTHGNPAIGLAAEEAAAAEADLLESVTYPIDAHSASFPSTESLRKSREAIRMFLNQR